MKKSPYFGNELRIDGYYYSNQEYHGIICVAVFYRDGFCIHTRLDPMDKDTLKCIETNILLNDAYINKIKNEPTHIGVFQIEYPDIQFETWESQINPFCHHGKVINDTTFIITKQINNRTKQTYPKNLTYKFKQFSPKPDSTNVYIK
jgi:hypothetical protein